MATNAVDQLEKMLTIAQDTFSPERAEKVEVLFEHFADRILVAPASGKEHYHNAYPGGYLDHVHNVIAGVLSVTKTMKAMNVEIDFTMEEAIFAAMFHDLGKLGDLTEPYYLLSTSQWHKDNRGELYTMNVALPFMKVPDRALQLLNHFEISVTPKEWKAILISDGLYSDGNKPYFMSYQYPPADFQTNLHYVIHFADHISTIGERDKCRGAQG